jgi:hypothetical protein
MSTALFFLGEINRLAAKNAQVFIVNGNHDAECPLGKVLPYPDHVHIFDHREPESKILEDLKVCIHGQSYAQRDVTENLAKNFPAGKRGYFNVGVLHTNATGDYGNHADYAPCSKEDLLKAGYEYWALGHIHKKWIVHEDPWIVFPGNLQGRHIKETGPKGFMEIEVLDGQVESVNFRELNLLSWKNITVCLRGFDSITSAANVIRERLRDSADKNIVSIFRLNLEVERRMHDQYLCSPHTYREYCRSLLLEFGFYLEKLKVKELPAETGTGPFVPGEDHSEWRELSERIIQDPKFLEEAEEIVSTMLREIPRSGLSGEPGSGSPVQSIDSIIENSRLQLFARLSSREIDED